MPSVAPAIGGWRLTAEVRVLGTLEVIGAAGAVPLAARKHRLLLAALTAARGRPCSADLLVDALWGAAPPSSAAKLVQVYVSQLRKVLPDGVVIRTQAGGYALELPRGTLDADRFERLVEEGRQALREGNPVLAASLLRRALELWRGPAYGGFAAEEFARADAERLEELRRAALEDRFDAELAAGRHRELLPELLSAAETQPLRERVQAQAMLALYRCGRQTDALDRYRVTREQLRDELGVDPGEALRDLQQRILRQDPALLAARGHGEPAAAVPLPPSRMLGRDRELAEVCGLLTTAHVRLVVLTGAGGSGKTRLALQVAADCAGSFANGAAFVSLAPVRDPALLLTAVLTQLGLPQVGDDPLEAVVTALGSREMLLVLDNAEHLRTAAPVLVDLLARAPRLTLLVTSRVVLRLTGEHVYPVQPLAEEAAADLFCERAREADPGFDPDPPTRRLVARLCARLDGLPLAVELAAGRVRALTVAELLDRLEARLPVLTGGPGDLPDRQRTLRATLEWSFGQLEPDGRRDLARLSVFAGGWTLDAAEAVCDTPLERLAGLVDHHLVVRTATPHGSRFSMLETVREFAAERLAESGEAAAVRQRHAEHMLRVAEALGLSVDELASGTPQRHDLAALEQDNVRAALDWAVGNDPELGLRLACALEQFWVMASPREGAEWLDALLARAGDLPPRLRARALRDAGGTAELAGDADRAERAYLASLELFGRLGDEAAQVHLQQRLSNVAVLRRDLAGARAVIGPALVRARDLGLRFDEANLIETLAVVELYEGNVDAAYKLALDSLGLARDHGLWVWGLAVKCCNLAEFAARLGRIEEAEGYGQEALALTRGLDRITTVYALASLAIVARAAGDLDRAGRLWGAIEAEEERFPLGRWPVQRDEYAELVVADDPAFERGRRAGWELAFDDAVAEAARVP